MIEVYVYYALLMILVFFISMSSLPKKLKLRRSAIVVLYLAFAFGSYYSFTKMLGNPVPIELIAPWDIPSVEKAEIIGFWFVEDEGIYLLLMHEGLKVPKYYKFPWNKNLAQQIQDAAEKSANGGKNESIILGNPFQRSWEDDKRFIHPFPQPMQPSKPPSPFEILNLDRMS